MRRPLSTPRQRYYHLMSLVCEDLSTDAIETLVRKEQHPATAAQLTAVRQGRKVDLPWLIDLVRVGLPDFELPVELLPTEEPAPLFAPATT